MNALTSPELDAVLLVEIVDLKWLLAGEGLHLHVERLQRDPEYARRLLDAASQSKNAAVRIVVARVRAQLGQEGA